MVTLASKVEFCLTVIDRRTRPGNIEPVYELFRFGTEFVTVLTLIVALLALGRLWRCLWVSVWDWLVEDWGRDWALICEAVRLLFNPRGLSYGSFS